MRDVLDEIAKEEEDKGKKSKKKKGNKKRKPASKPPSEGPPVCAEVDPCRRAILEAMEEQQQGSEDSFMEQSVFIRPSLLSQK